MKSGILSRKPQTAYMSDAEYIRNIKDPNLSEDLRQRYRYELFTKYMPLIRKMARKFNLSAEDTEDYVSESFFVVIKVIDYTDVTKINDDYSFGYFLRFNLLNKGIQGVKKSKRREAKVGTQISWDAVVDGGNFRPDEMMVTEEEALGESEVYNPHKQVASLLQRIPESEMTPRDKGIMKSIMEGHNCKEVSDKFGISQQRVLKIKKTGLEIMREYAKEALVH